MPDKKPMGLSIEHIVPPVADKLEEHMKHKVTFGM